MNLHNTIGVLFAVAMVWWTIAGIRHVLQNGLKEPAPYYKEFVTDSGVRCIKTGDFGGVSCDWVKEKK